MNNRVCCWILAIVGAGFLLFIGLIVAAVIGASALLSSGLDRHASIENGSYLVVGLSGAIDETRATPPFARMFSGDDTPTMTQTLIALKRAAKDTRIAGVILKPTGARGFAEIREIREAVRDFKRSGKPVFAYLEVATDRDYYLASVADSIVMFPARSGGLHLEGIGLSSTYLARTFEKIGIKFHVVHAGAYKGAFENLAKDQMSPALRESLEYVFFDLFETYVGETDSTRDKLQNRVFREGILNGSELLISGESALKQGFADGIADWEEFSADLSNDDELKTVSVAEFVSSTHVPSAGKHVAVVFAEGEINYSLDGSPLGADEGVDSRDMINRLRDLREDDDVQAVVLRVNSPGGSALASELILRELLRLKAAKTVVVSMGRVAASGGYYLACGADWIVAQPNTITGSIGVVSAFPTAESLYEKAGANVEVITKGKWAEFFRLDKELNPQQEAALTHVMGGIYDEFKSRVEDARRLSPDSVEAIAQGRIWTGKQALERNLVDELGGLREAVNKAVELAEIDSTDLHVKYYTEQEDLVNYVLRRLNVSMHATWAALFIGPERTALRDTQRLLESWAGKRDFVQLLCPVQLDY